MYYYREAEKILDAIKTQLEVGRTFKGEYFLTEATNIYLERGAKMKTQEVDVWLDAGLPDALLETNEYLLGHGRGNKFSPGADVKVIEPCFIHPDAKISNSTIGPYASIQKDCTIQNSQISSSILDEGTVVDDSKLNNSILGRKVLVKNVNGILDLGDNSRAVCNP